MTADFDPEASLVCPSCGGARPATERFCPDCGLPVVPPAPARRQPIDERHRRARKIKPQLTEGPLMRVAGARNQAEAEFVQGLLLEAGVPSVLRRSAGFDVPDFLAAGPRDVLVAHSGLATAREVLLDAEVIRPNAAARSVAPLKLLVGLVLALALGAALIWAALALS